MFCFQDSKGEQLDPVLFDGIEWLGFGEPSRHLVIITLRARGAVKGHLVLGLNPRREYDDDHKHFITDLVRQLREVATRVTAEEETQMRQDHLLMRLGDTERRMSRLAEIAPVGMYDFATTGEVVWANSHFYDILGVPQEHRGSTFVWKDYILPEDHDQSMSEMAKSLIDGVGISGSVRTRRHYTPPRTSHNDHPVDEPFWIMYSTSPDFAADGSVQSLKGSLSDISHLEWTEQLHVRNAEAALRARRRQEEFIDITSHEMRNPLSAITQCADSVVSSYQEAEGIDDAQSLIEIIQLSAEAAGSILLCAAHQRRIIDDILTLGKLDSELLTICPLAFHPSDVLSEAANMFKTEFEVNKIEAKTVVDPACTLTPSSTVYGDASRLMQILVNLLTNAIKFTRGQQTRNVTIRFGTSKQDPATHVFGPDFDWHPTGTDRPDLTKEHEYGQGEEIYLYFAVVDSGIGIPADYKEKVFPKFEQAERRSHTKYGGSGLGLYISRELAERQGGRIGISSEDGVGSTFAFFIRARLAEKTKPDVAIGEPTNATPTAVSMITQPTIVTTPSAPQPPSSVAYNILLVEDNLLNQKILAKQLTKAGCTVHVSNNGAEAIDTMLSLHSLPLEFGTSPPAISRLAEQNSSDISRSMSTFFDCLLMDWEMPICEGLRATRRIRELEKSEGCKRNVIIGVTANARAEQIKMAMEAGMDRVVPKPFRVKELLGAIKGLVGK
jgi:signal transduction histidine kinase